MFQKILLENFWRPFYDNNLLKKLPSDSMNIKNFFTFLFLYINDIFLATVDDIPRCYYNIFFIYYDKFSLEIQPISEFPASVNCPSLFRFGFDLEAEIWEYFLQTDKTVVLANERRNCGFPGITKVCFFILKAISNFQRSPEIWLFKNVYQLFWNLIINF